MPADDGRTRVDLSESSIYGQDQFDLADGDRASEAAIDRLERTSGGADEPVILDGELAEGDLGRKFDALQASTEEELDALRVNLLQDDALPEALDGSGLVVDDLAEERLAKLTETGPYQGVQGVAGVSPGTDDTGSILRRHRLAPWLDADDAILEGNIEQPEDEMQSGSAAEERSCG